MPLLGSTGLAWSGIVAVSVVSGVAQASILLILVKLAVDATGGSGAAPTVEVGPMSVEGLSTSGLFATAMILAVVILLSGWFIAWQTASLSSRALITTRKFVLEHQRQAAWATQVAERDGYLQELMSVHAGWMSNGVIAISRGLVGIASFAAMVLAAIVVSPVAAVLISGLSAVLLALLRPIGGMIKQASSEVAADNLEVVERTSEAVSLSLETSIYDVRDSVSQRIRGTAERMVPDYHRLKFLTRLSVSLTRDVALVTILGAMWVMYLTDLAGGAVLAAVVILLARSVTYSQMVQQSVSDVRGMQPYARELLRAARRYSGDSDSQGWISLDHMHNVSLDHVSFEYPDGTAGVHDIDLDILQGTATGIVGPSGSGKSTLFQLLLRLRNPSDGRIDSDGVDASTVAIESWRRHLVAVPQDPVLFRGTLRDNIAFFRSDIPEEALRDAADKAGLASFVSSLPDGLDTEIGPRGGTVSGGQRQRIGIARALAGRPSVLLLDEPTSALDSDSERHVIDTLRGLRGTVTLVIIAHRLSTVEFCDSIVMLNNGRLDGVGPPSEMLSRIAAPALNAVDEGDA